MTKDEDHLDGTNVNLRVYCHHSNEHNATAKHRARALGGFSSSGRFRTVDLEGLQDELEPYTVRDDYFHRPRRGDPMAAYLALGPLLPSVNPYLVLPRYYSEEETDQIAAAGLSVLKRGCLLDYGAGETRIFAVEQFLRANSSLHRFNTDQQLLQVAAHHHKVAAQHAAVDAAASRSDRSATSSREPLPRTPPPPSRPMGSPPLERCETMVGHVLARGRTVGASAGGWHKDKSIINGPGFKALLYLQDVRARGQGPFMMLLGYRDHAEWMAGGLDTCNTNKQQQPRFAESDVLAHVRSSSPRARVVEIFAPKGSVVLFETSSIHRGGDVVNSSRAVAINYYDGLVGNIMSRACAHALKSAA